MEVMYLAEKNRININLQETLDMIESSAKYTIIDLTPEILQVVENINFYELHDRLILATAKWLEIKILSSDRSQV
jgi:PIN domain nuclease of toxin-antitoxin system